MRTFFYYSLFFFSLGLLSTPAFSQPKGMKPVISGTERRLALVIGNRDYPGVGNLKNPLNDATDMETALKLLGFEVIKATNTDYRAFLSAVNRFKDQLSSSDVAFFYYSGHGASYDGQNYLLPTDTDISCLEQIEVQGISLNRILGEISAKKVKNSFVVLDACRNLPKHLKLCDNTKKDLFTNVGLVHPTNNPRGSLVVYATEEGSTADDNPNARNGLFTGALLHYLTKPNLTIRNILDQASLEVENKSNGTQSPGRYDKIYGDFYFVTSTVPAPVSPQPDDASKLYGTPSGVKTGMALNVSGWEMGVRPQVNDNFNESGRIVFEIIVDDTGDIISIRVKETTVSQSVVDLYKRAVSRMKLVPKSENVPSTAKGTITFNIKTR